jgi:hypothetical protein
MRCKRDKLTGIVACFINEITDYDHGGAIDLEKLPATLKKDVKGKEPKVRVKDQEDNVGLHTVVADFVTEAGAGILKGINNIQASYNKINGADWEEPLPANPEENKRLGKQFNIQTKRGKGKGLIAKEGNTTIKGFVKLRDSRDRSVGDDRFNYTGRK